MGLIDTHCHLDMLRTAPDEPLAEAWAAGVEGVIAVGIDLASSRTAAALAGRYDGVFATAGVHPHEAVHFDGVVRTGLEQLLGDQRVVAVGECGLDFYRDLAPRDVQRAVFVEMLELAAAVSKPVVVHSRDAAGETFAVLTEHAHTTVVLHCFSTPEFVGICNERGYFMSFAGNLTYASAADLQRAAREAREELLLLETDAPYLTPVPHRGKPNRPARVTLTAAFLAQLRGWDAETVAAITTANARRAFGLLRP